MNTDQNVLRIAAVDAASLANELQDRMIGMEVTNGFLGAKEPGGDMNYYAPQGADANFNSVTVNKTTPTNNNEVTSKLYVDSKFNNVGNVTISDGNGVVTGMALSIGGTTGTFSISAGTYHKIGTADAVTYAGASNIPVTNITTQNATYIMIDITDNSVVQLSTKWTPQNRRSYIIIGIVVHSNRTTVNAVNNLPDVAINSLSQLNDLICSLKAFNMTGNVISANGANLSINKSAGAMFKRGVNFVNDVNDPFTIDLAGLVAPSNLRFRTSTGVETADTAVFPLNYESAPGVVTAIPSSRFAIFRIFLFPSNLIRVQYGQAVYQTMAEAMDGIYSEQFVTEDNIATNGLLRGYIIVANGTTSFLDTSKVKFISTDRWGEMPLGSTGGTTTLQGAYNNSIEPEIVTNTTLGAVSIKRGSVSDTDNVFEILNGSGTITAYVKGDGSNNFYPYADVKDPTGFTDPANITVSYNSTTRKVTLGGTVKALYQGKQVTTITAGLIDLAHDDTVGNWFLYYNGTNLIWSQTVWTFDMLQIAEVYYGATNKFAVREVHGFMDYATHENLHTNIGTYKKSGGAFSSYILSPTTGFDNVINRRPTLASTVIVDEDLHTTNASSSTTNYCRFHLSGAGVANYTIDSTDIVSAGANGRFNYNLNTGGTWTTVQTANNDYGKIFVVNIPVTSDATSQKYRTLYVMPQTFNQTLATIKALTPANVNWGALTGAGVNEFVFVGEIIVRSSTTSWYLVEVNVLSGSKVGQISIVNPTVTPNLSQVLTADNNGSKLGMLNIGTIDSGDTTITNGVWTVKAPVNTSVAGFTLTGSGTSAINGLYTATVDTTTVNGVVYPVYSNGTWVIFRDTWWWVISTNHTTQWTNASYYGAGNKETPQGVYQPNTGSYTGNPIVVAGTVVGSDIDSIVAEGSIYSDSIIKSKDGFNINGHALMIYDNQLGAEAFRISTANPDVQFAYYTADGNASLEGCNLANIGQYDDDILVKGVAIQPWYNAIKIQGVSVDVAPPANGQVLQYNGITYAPATIATGSPSVGAVNTVQTAGSTAGTFKDSNITVTNAFANCEMRLGATDSSNGIISADGAVIACVDTDGLSTTDGFYVRSRVGDTGTDVFKIIQAESTTVGGVAQVPTCSNTKIDNVGNKALITKEYAVANFATTSNLVQGTEGGKTGYWLIGDNRATKGDIGSNAIDFSRGVLASTTRGATGSDSLAEGYATTASGDNSHAEGAFAIAEGLGAHAEGYYTVATPAYSHAEGYENVITSNAPTGAHVNGQNCVNVTTNQQHVVGIGTSNAAKKNGFVVETTGKLLAPELTDTIVNAEAFDSKILTTKSWMLQKPQIRNAYLEAPVANDFIPIFRNDTGRTISITDANGFLSDTGSVSVRLYKGTTWVAGSATALGSAATSLTSTTATDINTATTFEVANGSWVFLKIESVTTQKNVAISFTFKEI